MDGLMKRLKKNLSVLIASSYCVLAKCKYVKDKIEIQSKE
jgi:hypothetical protein